MKANEFVKLRGISYCKELLIKADGCAAIQAREDRSRVSVDDLKRLIESHELVERVISCHNKSFKECQIDIHGLKSFVKKNPKIYPKRLKQAILDVESCNVD